MRQVCRDGAPLDTPSIWRTPQRHRLAAIGDRDVPQWYAQSPKNLEEPFNTVCADVFIRVEVFEKGVAPKGPSHASDSCRSIGHIGTTNNWRRRSALIVRNRRRTLRRAKLNPMIPIKPGQSAITAATPDCFGRVRHGPTCWPTST